MTMYAYVALEPQVFVFDGATPIPSDHITKAFWSDYGGAFATPITGFATYDSSSNTSFDLGGSTGAIPADQMTVENSVLAPVIKVEKRVHPVTVSSVNGATFGTYKSKFVFHDGVVGKTEVRINYMNNSYPIQSTEGPQGCFSPQSDATQVFETLTGFIGEPSSSVELQKSLQNIFTSINFGLGVLIAFNWETIGLVLVLSLVETYVGSLLDSNGLDWGSKSETFYKPTAGQGYAEYWDVVNYAEVDLTMIASLTPCTYKELTNRCQWSQAAAPFQKVVMQARENWDENGFVKRGAAPWFSSATYAENPSNTAKWCHYRYVGAPGPNPG